MAKVTVGGRDYEVEVRGTTVLVDGLEFPITVRKDGAYDTVIAGGVAYRVKLPAEADRATGMNVEVDYRPFTVAWDGRLTSGPTPLPRREPRSGSSAPVERASVPGGISSQIAGRVLSIKAKVGDAVEAGTVLLLLEAMKMENEIKATRAGTVKEILVEEGTRVTEGQTLMVVA